MKRLFVLLVLLLSSGTAFASAIPAEAHQYKKLVVRSVVYDWGGDGPVAFVAALFEVESGWNKLAQNSCSRASGLGQFIPSTGVWWSKMAGLGKYLPEEPLWAIPATSSYLRWEYNKTSGETPAHRLFKGAMGYNGGGGNLRKDEHEAKRKGLNPGLYTSIQRVNGAGRSAANKRENNEYPEKIIARETKYKSWGNTSWEYSQSLK